MSPAFPEHTGIREQHLLRMKDNPLFDADRREVSNEALARARMEDGLEMDHFMADFQNLVQRAVALAPNTPSEVILEIKEDLDRSYQRCCTLPVEQDKIKDAIRTLIATIMRAVEAGIGNDAYARQQLQDEEIARKLHFEMQELPLVAALTAQDSPVAEDELIPSLLSEALETLAGTLQLFDASQLASIYNDAEQFLQQHDPQQELPAAWQRLRLIEEVWRDMQPGTTVSQA